MVEDKTRAAKEPLAIIQSDFQEKVFGPPIFPPLLPIVLKNSLTALLACAMAANIMLKQLKQKVLLRFLF